MYILDTVLVSYIFREDSRAQLYAAEIESDGPLYISCQSIAELYYGAESDGWGMSKRQKLTALLGEFVMLLHDEETAKCYATIRAGGKRLGRVFSPQDNWILANAKQYGLVLLSHDKDMMVGEELGIEVICRA